MADFSITGTATVVLLHPHTPAAAAWIAQHLGESDTENEPQHLKAAPAIEPRYLPPILDGIAAAGLTVEVDL